MSPLLAADHAREAAALEVEANGDPHGDALLVEAANQWRLAGDPARCRELLGTVIGRGGEAGCFARAELIGLLLESGGHDAASPELAALGDDPALTDGPCQLVAELLTDHGLLTTAVDWYDRAIARWDAGRLAAATAPDRQRGTDHGLLAQRRRVRKRLGLVPDATDALLG